MNLVDEEHVVLFEVVHDCREVGSSLDRRSRSDVDVDAELARNDMRKRRLAEARGPCEQNVIEHLSASARRIDRHAKNFLGALLADELRDSAWTQREIDAPIVLVADARGKPPFRWRRRRAGIFDWLTFR